MDELRLLMTHQETILNLALSFGLAIAIVVIIIYFWYYFLDPYTSSEEYQNALKKLNLTEDAKQTIIDFEERRAVLKIKNCIMNNL